MEQLREGQIWEHQNGNRYRILVSYVSHTETSEALVIYQDVAKPTYIWARPRSMWFTPRDGKPRFILIENALGATPEIKLVLLRKLKEEFFTFKKKVARFIFLSKEIPEIRYRSFLGRLRKGEAKELFRMEQEYYRLSTALKFESVEPFQSLPTELLNKDVPTD